MTSGQSSAEKALSVHEEITGELSYRPLAVLMLVSVFKEGPKTEAQLRSALDGRWCGQDFLPEGTVVNTGDLPYLVNRGLFKDSIPYDLEDLGREVANYWLTAFNRAFENLLKTH